MVAPDSFRAVRYCQRALIVRESNTLVQQYRDNFRRLHGTPAQSPSSASLRRTAVLGSGSDRLEIPKNTPRGEGCAWSYSANCHSIPPCRSCTTVGFAPFCFRWAHNFATTIRSQSAMEPTLFFGVPSTTTERNPSKRVRRKYRFWNATRGHGSPSAAGGCGSPTKPSRLAPDTLRMLQIPNDSCDPAPPAKLRGATSCRHTRNERCLTRGGDPLLPVVPTCVWCILCSPFAAFLGK